MERHQKELLWLLCGSSQITATSCVGPQDTVPAGPYNEPVIDNGMPINAYRRISTTNPPSFAEPIHLTRFYKGNIHTHSRASDGDQPPSEVILWYRAHGYQFFSLTDHNLRVATADYEALEGPDFKLIPGEEVSMSTSQGSAVHVNGLCINEGIGKLPHASKIELLSWAVSFIQVQPGAIFQLNHPNYHSMLQFQDLTPIPDGSLMEIANQKDSIAKTNKGVGPFPSTEVLWDRLLSRGRKIYGTASDDTHDLYRASRGSLPGRGWIDVAASSLSAPDLCKAMSEGLFYASNGVVLTSIDAEADTIALLIDPGDQPSSNFKTEFIGWGGEVLDTQIGLKPSYQLRGTESYVRARVTDGKRKHAWTQPQFLP